LNAFWKSLLEAFLSSFIFFQGYILSGSSPLVFAWFGCPVPYLWSK